MNSATNISNTPLTITLPGRVSNPALGDSYTNVKAGTYYVWNGVRWITTDVCGNRVPAEEQERNELHAKYPQLAALWEEYSIMKKLLVGDSPGKEYGKGKTKASHGK